MFFYVHALDLSYFTLQSAFSWFFLTPTALKHCHKFAVPSVEILQHSKTDFCVHPNDRWHFFQLFSVTRFSTARMVCMKNWARCFDFKSVPIPHSWVRRNSSESTSFNFGPVQRVFQGEGTPSKALSLHTNCRTCSPPAGTERLSSKLCDRASSSCDRFRWVTSRWKAWDLSKSASFVWGRDRGVRGTTVFRLFKNEVNDKNKSLTSNMKLSPPPPPPPIQCRDNSHQWCLFFLDVWLCAWLRGYLLLEYYKSIPTHDHRQYRFVVFGNTWTRL